MERAVKLLKHWPHLRKAAAPAPLCDGTCKCDSGKWRTVRVSMPCVSPVGVVTFKKLLQPLNGRRLILFCYILKILQPLHRRRSILFCEKNLQPLQGRRLILLCYIQESFSHSMGEGCVCFSVSYVSLRRLKRFQCFIYGLVMILLFCLLLCYVCINCEDVCSL